jgi:cysteine-rich repeat protein
MPSTTSAVLCYDNPADPNVTCTTGLPKPQPFTLGIGDGANGGPDTACCEWLETITADSCSIPFTANRVDDEVRAQGLDDAPGTQFDNLPVSGSATNAVIVRCCGNGEVDQPGPPASIETELCDTDPQGSVPNDLPKECPTCPDGIANACRLPGTPFECTLCGDGVVQEPLEECDDGNTNNTDSCRKCCTHAF